MTNTLNNIIFFAAGAVIGSAVTWKIVKTKYEQIAQEEIDSVKAVYLNRQQNGSTIEEKDEDFDDDYQGLYQDKVDTLGYVNYSNTVPKKKEDDRMRPYVIAPEDYDTEDDYTAISLTYYADGFLTDENDELVEDVDEIVGSDFASHFGEYEDDAVHIRNDERKCDYEILAVVGKYADVKKLLYPQMED